MTLTDAERDTILMALWDLKLHTGAVHAAEAGLSGDELSNALQYIATIDDLALKLGGTLGPLYGLGETI